MNAHRTPPEVLVMALAMAFLTVHSVGQEVNVRAAMVD
jgi:hypothetical protein